MVLEFAFLHPSLRNEVVLENRMNAIEEELAAFRPTFCNVLNNESQSKRAEFVSCIHRKTSTRLTNAEPYCCAVYNDIIFKTYVNNNKDKTKKMLIV